MKIRGLFLIVSLLALLLSFSACGEKAERADDGEDASADSLEENNTIDNGSSETGTTGGNSDDQKEETPEEDDGFTTLDRSLGGTYRSEEGWICTFEKRTFTYDKKGYFFWGTYEIKQAEDGSLRIFLTVKQQGTNASALQSVTPFVIESESEPGLSFAEGEGYIKIDITKYFFEQE